MLLFLFLEEEASCKMGSTFKLDGGKIEIIKGELGVPSLKLTARASENWDPKIWSPKLFGPASSPPVETIQRYNMLACYPYVYQQFHVHQLTPKKTLSNGLFLSKAAGFINHMTTNFKKCVKEKHTSLNINTINIKLLHKPQSTQKKTLHALTSQQKNPRYWFITRRIQGYLGHRFLLPPSSPPLMAAVVCVHGSVLVPRCRCP